MVSGRSGRSSELARDGRSTSRLHQRKGQVATGWLPAVLLKLTNLPGGLPPCPPLCPWALASFLRGPPPSHSLIHPSCITIGHDSWPCTPSSSSSPAQPGQAQHTAQGTAQHSHSSWMSPAHSSGPCLHTICVGPEYSAMKLGRTCAISCTCLRTESSRDSHLHAPYMQCAPWASRDVVSYLVSSFIWDARRQVACCWTPRCWAESVGHH